jgi:GNAT superfamily N-acetyltransferase
MKIEIMEINDYKYLRDFSPKDWGDVTARIVLFQNLDFCYPIKFVDCGKILGIGTAIFYESTCWIAHLVIDENCRNKGYGTKILEYLCDYCINNGYKTILLFATDMGYPLYKKYGFNMQAEYTQYEKTNDIVLCSNENIKNIELNDHKKILELDKLVTGEGRQKLLLQNINNGFVYKKNGIISGYYLKNLSEGLVIAENEEAGLELLKLRVSENKYLTIPIENETGNNYLRENNFKEIMKKKRMIYGNEIKCNSSKIYSRIDADFG